jgi:P27 family predicted phage terminase small subunit
LNAGRPRKTRAQHELHGTTPARPNLQEPQYPIEAPGKPAYIAANAIASAEWDRVLPMLIEQRVMTPAFRAALENYVTAYADVVAGERLKAEPGFAMYLGEKLKLHPVVKLVNDARRELRSWAGVLGLLPTTVGKVSAAPPAPAEDEEDAILNRLERRPGTVVAFNGR